MARKDKPVLPLREGTHIFMVHKALLQSSDFLPQLEIAHLSGLTLNQVSSIAGQLVTVGLAEPRMAERRLTGETKRRKEYKGYPEDAPLVVAEEKGEKTPPPDQIIPPEITKHVSMRSMKQIRKECNRFDENKIPASRIEFLAVVDYVYSEWVKRGRSADINPANLVGECIGVHSYGDGSAVSFDENGDARKEWLVTPRLSLPADNTGHRLRLRFTQKSTASKESFYKPILLDIDANTISH